MNKYLLWGIISIIASTGLMSLMGLLPNNYKYSSIIALFGGILLVGLILSLTGMIQTILEKTRKK